MTRMRALRYRFSFLLALVAVLLTGGAAAPRSDSPEWLDIDYRPLVDEAELTHSGESVGRLLARLGAGGDAKALALLDPHLERYAFVLPDAFDTLVAAGERPFVEVGWLYEPGAPAPAWAELLRARQLLVESDGQGRVRAFLPAKGDAAGSEGAAAAALEDAWPVLRLVLAAERRRLAAAGAARPLALAAYAYRHDRARSRFTLGTVPTLREVSATEPSGTRPPLDLAGLETFLARGLALEGGVLEEGRLRLLGSEGERAPSLLGEAVSLADFAVAYRAIFHGGLAEPYMSLDRGPAPHRSTVNYGGRLRDTRLGLVSLLCDVRFKTFSLGLDPATGEDVRERIRRRVPEFRTHVERFAADPSSAGVMGQQTRLWFYPDDVDLTLSPDGQVMVMRAVRMTAAAERAGSSAADARASETRAWTRALVDELNADYDALAALHPELSALDQSVRLLTLFSWLHLLEREGELLPELDVLLDVELPALRTPTSHAQMLAFNGLNKKDAAVAAYGRLDVVGALDRLVAAGPSGSPASWLASIAGGLDARDPREGALRERVLALDSANAEPETLRELAYAALRLRMHRLVLSTLGVEARQELAAKAARGEDLRVFSVGIGGLDLGMQEAVAGARGRALTLRPGGGVSVAGSASPRRARVAPKADASWRREAARESASVLPPHGLIAERGNVRTSVHGAHETTVRYGSSGQASESWVLLGRDSPWVRARVVALDKAGRAGHFSRVDGAHRTRYSFVRDGAQWTARLDTATIPLRSLQPKLPSGLASLRLLPVSGEGAARRVPIILELDGRPPLQAGLPEPLLARMALGRECDLGRGAPLGGFEPLPPALASADALMVFDRARSAPWHTPFAHTGWDPPTVAEALQRWWRGGQGEFPAVAVGTHLEQSPRRWEAARALGNTTRLLVPSGALEGLAPSAQRALDRALAPLPRHQELGGELPERVVLVSGEAPGALGERLRALAKDPRLAGKRLVVLSLAAPLRADRPAALLAESALAAFGVVRGVEEGAALREETLGKVLGALAAGENPPELLWYY